MQHRAVLTVSGGKLTVKRWTDCNVVFSVRFLCRLSHVMMLRRRDHADADGGDDNDDVMIYPASLRAPHLTAGWEGHCWVRVGGGWGSQ